MTAGPTRYALRCVRSPQEWAAYHAIRRQAIFAALLPGQAKDETDPDEVAPGNFPHVLLHDGKIVGAISLDQASRPSPGGHPERSPAARARPRPAQACARRARRLGKTAIIINAHPTSLGFYLANGYRRMGDAGSFPATLIRAGKRLR